MTFHIRLATDKDVEACGAICYTAFRTIALAHNFHPDFPDPEAAEGLIRMAIGHPDVYAVVAETGGRVIGSNFLWEQSSIAGVGPITIDPQVQNQGVGQRLMQSVFDRSVETARAGVRLVQAAYHGRSLSLYAKLGFDAREPLANLQGTPIRKSISGHVVRQATKQDLESCNSICKAVHGHDRSGEVLDAIGQGIASVVERDGRISGYTTCVGFFGHAVGEANSDIMALIAAAPAFAGPGLLVPTRNSDLLRWCLQEGLRVMQPMTLMSRGYYVEPRGAFLPSILF
ncbi:MAG TPA: GNAT family N-acetyltransferase [Alphaproteobacteria bacterium]|nr:GNAT family N-acetyltransferase [Alphaproteobacteria bacterium]